MRTRKKREAQALLGAILVHVLLFLIAALGGFFTFVHRVTDTDPAEVEVYDLSAGDSSGGAGGGSPPVSVPSSEVPEIVISDRDMPPVREDERKASEAQGVQGEASKGVIGGRGGGGDGSDGISPDPPPLPPPPPPPPPPKERIEASLASEAAPVYPPDLIEAEVEGSVTIRINVAEDGEIESVRVLSSSGYSEMDHAAIEAGWRFRFHPGDGGRKGTWTKTFRFRLN